MELDSTTLMYLALWVTIFTVNLDSLLQQMVKLPGLIHFGMELHGCVADTAHSCDRYGWFHRETEPTQDDIEVRWCGNQERNEEDVYTDLLEI